MGQGCRRRGPVLASAGQRPVRRASLRLRRSRPAALGPRGLPLAGPRLQGCLAGQGRRHARRRGWVTAAAWHVRAPCSGRPRSTARRPRGSETTAARHALAPRSGRPRPKARRLGGSGDHHCPPPAGAPLRPAEVDDAPAVGVLGLPQPGTRGRPRSGPPRSRASTRLKREGR